MNPRELYLLLNEVVPDIKLEFSPGPYPNSRNVTNIKTLHLAFNELLKLDVGTEIIRSISLHNFMQLDGDAVIDLAEIPAVESKFASLKNVLEEIEYFMQRNSYAEDELTAYIRLPELQNFDTLSKVSKDLNTIFTQTILRQEIQGNVVIKSVEAGSIIIIVGVGSLIALKYIAELTHSAYVIRRQALSNRLVEEHVTTTEVKNETILDLQEANKKLIDRMVELEAKRIANEFLKIEDAEEIERIKHSISLLTELILKGASIQPAISAAPEAKELFPKKGSIETITSRIKQLGPGSKE